MCRKQPAENVELADLFAQFGHQLSGLDYQRQKIISDITSCRTEKLGGHRYLCDHCGNSEVAYNSCFNRHCPKCQSLQQARWLDKQMANLLPIPYFHAVFTIPCQLHPIFLTNRVEAYRLLFAAVSETLKEVALKRLGAKIGITCILHTWTQKLHYHPHIHCIVSGGGLSPDHSQWIKTKQKYLLPRKILSLVFRGKLLSKIEKGLKNGRLHPPTEDPDILLQQAAHKNWMIYLKRPMAGPEQVLKYLGHYTHRIAISNHRIIALDGKQVTFSWRDRKDNNQRKHKTEPVIDFLKRFLLHVVAKQFVRIRHYGFLANPVRNKYIPLCRDLLGVAAHVLPETTEDLSWDQVVEKITGSNPLLCPACKHGHLVKTDIILAARSP